MLRFHIGKMEADRWKHCWVEVDGAAFRSIILLSVIILCVCVRGGFCYFGLSKLLVFLQVDQNIP